MSIKLKSSKMSYFNTIQHALKNNVRVFVLTNTSPSQFVPFPWKPRLHWQVYLVARFTHEASAWQLLPRLQKSVSVKRGTQLYYDTLGTWKICFLYPNVPYIRVRYKQVLLYCNNFDNFCSWPLNKYQI